MTHNVEGRILSALVSRTKRYSSGPYSPFEGEFTTLHIIGRVGCLRFARNPIGYILVPMLMPAVGRGAVEVPFRVLATARLTRLDLALRCYQLEHGKLPESLDVLAPEYLKTVPVDPFTGKPFGYEATGANPRLWSVGPDQKTDPEGSKKGDDVVVPLTFAGG